MRENTVKPPPCAVTHSPDIQATHILICVALCAAALQQVIQNDPVDGRLEAVLAPALAPILAYVGRTPAFSDAIAEVAGANSTLVRMTSCLCSLHLVSV